MIQESFIHYRANLLHYVKAGNGKHPLLVIHGFGQDHTLYMPLVKSLSPIYTLYIIDLFFHGKSEWNERERPVQKSDWNNFLGTLLLEQNIDTFSIMAYSLGGKFAFATLEGFPERIKKLFLLAPDGIRTSPWYRLATYPTVSRRIFKSMIKRHNRFLWIARRLSESKLLDKGVIRFADRQMNSEEGRRRVYASWVMFRHLSSDMKHIGELINMNGIQLTVIVGKHDKVVRPAYMNRLLKHVRDYKLEMLESGHTGLVREALPLLMVDK